MRDHASFSVERDFPVPPARAFAAFADPDLKSLWFRGPDGWEPRTRVLDFREGAHALDDGAATRLVFTEQVAYFEGGEAANADREEGTVQLLKQLEATL